MKRILRLSAMTLWLLVGHVLARAQSENAYLDNTYLGPLYTYNKAESYSSLFGGKVHLLEPAGYDVLHDGSKALLIEGVISPETTANVKSLLKRVPGIRIVFVDSPGGDLFAGLALGRVLASVDVQAIVGPTAQCASACALAFLGAKSRLILAQKGAFGFHRQYYIRNGEILYGSWRKDVSVIADYLKGIAFKGVQADEVVGTTGLITYSDERLEDRGIVTTGQRQIRSEIEATLAVTGISVTEKYAASCLLRTQEFDCGTVVYPFRLPMLLSHFSNGSEETFDVKTLQVLKPLLKSAKRNTDLSIVNCRWMKDGYARYLRNRLASLAKMSPPQAVLEGFTETAQREISSCDSMLHSSDSH